MPLKHVAALNPETLDESTDPAREFRYIDIGSTGRGRLTGEPVQMSFGESPSRARRIVRPGDTILSTVRTYLRAVWTLRDDDEALVASTGFVCLRPRHGVDPRYLGWLAESDVVIEEVIARSVGVSYPAINPSDIGLIKVPLPPLDEQRAIADYLDRETARIDALISAKRRLAEAVAERMRAVVDDVIWSDLNRKAPLMHLVDPARPVMYGIVLPGPDVGDPGIAVVKGGDVAKGRLTWTELCKTTPEIEAPYARARLRGNDVLVAIRGGIGDVALVPAELDGANITQDVARVAPHRGVDPVWLLYALQSATAQSDMRKRVTGATITGLNIWELDRVRVPVASGQRQTRDLVMLTAEQERTAALTSALVKQVELLAEHRRALITAAVQGQLRIAVAA